MISGFTWAFPRNAFSISLALYIELASLIINLWIRTMPHFLGNRGVIILCSWMQYNIKWTKDYSGVVIVYHYSIKNNNRTMLGRLRITLKRRINLFFRNKVFSSHFLVGRKMIFSESYTKKNENLFLSSLGWAITFNTKILIEIPIAFLG